jgi:NitT/TauT family transport system permease protein
LWHLGSLALGKPFLPTPAASFAAFIHLLFKAGMARHFIVSALRVLVSIALAVILAVPLGLWLGRNRTARHIIGPLVYILYPLPKVVFLPIFVVLLGLGNAPKVLLITTVIFFQIVVVTKDAAKSIPQASLQSMRSLNAGPWQTLWHLTLPYCLPKIMTSLRVSLGTAIAVLFFAETFASFDGLGYFILNGMETREYPAMYAGIIGMALLGLGFYGVIDLLERRLCKWAAL